MSVAGTGEGTRPAPAGLGEVWQHLAAPRDVDGYAGMVQALRDLHDDLTAAAPPAAVVAEARSSLTRLSELLRPYAVGERDQVAGHLAGVPGRGQAMSPAIDVHELDDRHAVGRVTFGRFYLGGNGAVHGGVLPLVFDELMGRLSSPSGRMPARTAYLHVDYRAITPIGTGLRIEARFDREEGRKRFLSGTLHDGGVLCAEARGLFVELRPGQP